MLTATDADLVNDDQQPNTATADLAATHQWAGEIASLWNDLFDTARRLKNRMEFPQIPTLNGDTEDTSQVAAVGPEATRAFLDYLMERSGYFAHVVGQHEQRLSLLLDRPRRLRT